MSEVIIRSIKENEITPINSSMKSQWPDKHLLRFKKQELGEAIYPFAWINDLPVGHLYLKWDGSTDEYVKTRLTAKTPDIEDLFILPEYRKKGIGSSLLDFSEALAQKKGYFRLGLSVSVEDIVVRNMYEKRGYLDAGFGNYEESCSFVDSEGKSHSWKEICVYLTKEI